MTDRYADYRPSPDRDAMNGIKYWFPKIEHCGLKSPKTVIVDTTPELVRAAYMEDPAHDEQVFRDFVNEKIEPEIEKAGLGLVFLKNGSFSNKFDASSSCLPIRSNLAHALVIIMQSAMEHCGFQYDGTDTVAVRERIRHLPSKTPCIYNGLPFRTEYRLFYDFDRKEPIFIHDYWDKEYVYPHLHDMTDKIVYDAWYQTVKARYDANEQTVLDTASKALEAVDGLQGPWSVDILEDEKGGLWLIDMAVAEMSAYWEYRPGHARPEPQPIKTPGKPIGEGINLIKIAD